MERGSINVEQVADVAVVSLIGDHDITTAPEVWDVLASFSAGSGGLVVSLTETEFFDSGVVHALFTTDQRLQERDRRLVLHVATASIVARMLEVTGLREHLPCASSLDEALLWAARQSGGA